MGEPAAMFVVLGRSAGVVAVDGQRLRAAAAGRVVEQRAVANGGSSERVGSVRERASEQGTRVPVNTAKDGQADEE
jgi:hypothetical protein